MTKSINQTVIRLMGLIDDFGYECRENGDDRKFTNNDADVAKARSDLEIALRTELAANISKS